MSDINFFQGTRSLESNEKEIKEKIKEFSNIKNIHFLLGAGVSSEAIPDMKKMKIELENSLNKTLKEQYGKFESENIENMLGAMYAKKHYLEKTSQSTVKIKKLIKHIQDFIYKKINIDFSINNVKKTLTLYKTFYQKIALRNKELARVNIFTTNNDLFNEKALDDLNINYNNGFGGGLERVFNPARFRYTFSQKIDSNLEKFEPLENMVYLYKLHGSISWVAKKDGNSLFDIQEIAIKGGTKKPSDEPVLIYPTPLKQGQSLGMPYSDLIREFQTKLSQANSVLFVIGYSFSDEHLNNIIYQSLTSNASLSIVIFGEHKDCPLSKIDDSRIYRIWSNATASEKIHYFNYIVDELLPDLDENKEKALLDFFVSKLREKQKD
ncbi:SIR2 family protein [Bathymodiolus thermophilus thioautotrophic gill symbiont]|uniref:Uncharacterized protein n=1 Tax=Bathymodiolus thermophilus thioautotrophic gill symbiont TaxID=2360 RepID=A0A1J5UHN4_9GAMM|nr:SIR2 family protein [Bathymodiolus thermophilus thioautotrophic gill symbiont]OIR23775.1 hypothetical protein BGC33_08040 [Bathymodiolus thermophilus thioautotrophic gill symbiont]